MDVGCGAGDNAAILARLQPSAEINGITHSIAEAKIARRHMTNCWIQDIEHPLIDELAERQFDLIIFSHVLEHTRHPAEVLEKFANLLVVGGSVLIAVPNTLSYRMRWHFLRGDFEYQDGGVLDDTHLRFFTYFTAAKYLLADIEDLEISYNGVTGAVPLYIFRRYLFPKTWCTAIDSFGCAHWPNLFGSQILIRAEKIS